MVSQDSWGPSSHPEPLRRPGFSSLMIDHHRMFLVSACPVQRSARARPRYAKRLEPSGFLESMTDPGADLDNNHEWMPDFAPQSGAPRHGFGARTDREGDRDGRINNAYVSLCRSFDSLPSLRRGELAWLVDDAIRYSQKLSPCRHVSVPLCPRGSSNFPSGAGSWGNI